MEPIILASGSPLRQNFFRLLNLPFSCIPAEIDETPPPGLSPRQTAENLALRKVMAVVEKNEKLGVSNVKWIFGADTIVVLNGEIFGKPADRADAQSMLERLSGHRHEVITAMALYKGAEDSRRQRTDCRSVVSEAAIAPLSGAEIAWYLDSGEWEGAAGSYRLQGLGACLITAVNGSPSGVAGLPLYEFYAMLRDNGYPVWGRGTDGSSVPALRYS
ncbi:MAG: Maf family protein [Treponema sp.]|jgi:septum formation protein|nr:Maf family protein [Treponema sp.]